MIAMVLKWIAGPAVYAPASVAGGDVLLLETGGTDNLLLESGDNLLLE